MDHWKRRFSLCSLFLLSLMACSTHQDRSQASVSMPNMAIDKTERYIYTPDHWPQALEARVRKPAGSGPYPAVLLIHGGGWQRGSPTSMSGVARRLTRQGFVTVNIEYRLSPEYTFPAALHDVQQAMHWMHEEAESLSLDKQRIAALGFSSGGHLAMLMAAVAGQGSKLDAPYGGLPTRPVALVAGGAPVDLREWSDGRLVNDFLGGPRDERIEVYEQASPIIHVHSDMPPTFLFHGTRDRVVKPLHAHAMKSALDKLSVESELYMAHYRGHFASFLFRRGAMNEATRFLHQKLDLPRDHAHETP